MKILLTTLALSCFLGSLQAQQAYTKLELKVGYNYTEDKPTCTYHLENDLLYRSSSHYKKDSYETETKTDTARLNTAQLMYLEGFLATHCAEDKYFPLCRALSPVYARLELLKKDGSRIDMSYAPCRSNLLAEPFASLQETLDKMFEE